MKLFDKKDNSSQNALFWAIALVVYIASQGTSFADPGGSSAPATSLGVIICNIKGNIGILPYICSVVSYISGAFLLVSGVLTLVAHFQNPNNGIVKSVAKLFSGAGLMSLPSFAGIVQRSIFPDISGGGKIGCSAVEAASGSNTSLDKMMQSFVANIYSASFSMVSMLGAGIGIYLIVKGLLKAAKIGSDPKAGSPHAIAVNFVMGALLVSISSLLDTTLTSVFGSSTIASFSNIINWSNITGSSIDTTNADRTVYAILKFVQIIGIIGFLRGWLIIKTAVEGTGQATVPQGATHIIGGTMAMNIPQMLKILNNTFGLNIIN